jgi:hypothetical protein
MAEGEHWIPDPHPVTIQVVEFQDGGLSISYVEESDVAEKVAMVKTIMIPYAVLEKSDWEDHMDTLRQWVDSGLLLLRQHRSK